MEGQEGSDAMVPVITQTAMEKITVLDTGNVVTYSLDPETDDGYRIEHMYYKDGRGKKELSDVDKAFRHRMYVAACLVREMRELGLTVTKQRFKEFCHDVIADKRTFDAFHDKYDLLSGPKGIRFVKAKAN